MNDAYDPNKKKGVIITEIKDANTPSSLQQQEQIFSHAN